MTRHAVGLARGLSLFLVAIPAVAHAQAITGVAEWTAANGSSSSDGVPYVNQSLWQRYTVGFKSVLLDPRFVEYNATTTFQTNGLTFGGADDRQRGHSQDLGYSLGASIFPSRPFPFFIQASRGTIRESGNYPISGGIRGSVPVPPGTESPSFDTWNESLAMGWRLASPSLPQVELDYRSSNSVVTSGVTQAEQHDVQLHARVSKDTRRTRQALTLQRTATDNLTTEAFNLRLTDLNYDASATLSQRNRLTLRIGRRRTFSLFDIASPIVDPGTGAYRLPSRGTVDAFYVISGVVYEPHHRVAIDLTTSVDRQDSREVETGAKLVSTSARVEPVRGLSVFATGAYGNRDQMVGGVTVDAMTQNIQAGASYRIGVRGLNANVGYTRGLGTNAIPGGGRGDIRAWSGQAGVSFSVRGLTVGGGYERANGEDEILDFGNYDNRRQFVTAQTQIGRLTITGAWDRSRLVRGLDLTFSEARQDTFSASASARVAREGRLTVTAGGFSSRGSFGHDQTVFFGGSFEAELRPRLMLTMAARYDDLSTTGTGLAQNSLGGMAKLEYRLRLFAFALEFQHHEQNLRYAFLPDVHTFNGRQLLLRVSRTFGVRF